MGRLSLVDAKTLYDDTESIVAVVEKVKERIQGIDYAALEARALDEQEWCDKNKVKILTITSPDYPARLRNCADAPLVLFVRGKADLNAPHIINIVGTRKCTVYGQDCINSIVTDLKTLCPDVIIVSGLAYGVDITAHRAALREGMPTIGIVAHGQDTLYPALHRNEANKMVLGNGAVITEYPRGTRPEARNFLQRNRLIAGISDATIIAESAAHGGGLVTARLSQDYGRDVFAIPGPINAEFSAGCNNLIRDNKAQLITSAEDIVKILNWKNDEAIQKIRQAGIARTLFVELTDTEQTIIDALKKHGDLQTNVLALHTSLPISTITSDLFTLEMKGIVTCLSGNTYHLIGV